MPGFRSYVDELAEAALAQAREDVPKDVGVQFTRIDARSIATGLIQAAEKYDASVIVVGSAMGRIEQVTVSSIADRLLHSSPIPVAVATRGFRAMGGKVNRVTLAFTGGEHGAYRWPRPRRWPLSSARNCGWPRSRSTCRRRKHFGCT